MANHTTGSQRHNKRMEAIFSKAKSEGRGLVGNSHTKNSGVNSPAMKAAIAKRMKNKSPDESQNHKQSPNYFKA